MLLHWLILSFLTRLAECGHEVLHGVKLDPSVDILPHELAIVQYDSRPLEDYWNSSAYWNFAFAQRWNHQYLFVSGSSIEDDEAKLTVIDHAVNSRIADKSKKNGVCSHPTNVSLSPVWCKVKAMMRAKRYLPSAKAFVFFDSDVVITLTNQSLTNVFAFMRKDLNWNYDAMPVAFNQDGPGWACRHTIEDIGYPYCFNSGAVFWRRHSISQKILALWWRLAADPYEKSRFTEDWRHKWPWEQAQMYPLYESYKRYIMRLSFPREPFLPWKSTKDPKAQYPTDFVEPWCFCHWPGANCFVTHFCGSLKQKRRLRDEYLVSSLETKFETLPVRKMY